MAPECEYRLIDRLINESTLAARLYLGLASTLIVFAIALLVLSQIRPSSDSLEKIIGAVVALFGAIPFPLFLGARAQRVGLISLKESWEDAKAKNDQRKMKQLSAKLDQIQYRVIEKGLGAIR